MAFSIAKHNALLLEKHLEQRRQFEAHVAEASVGLDEINMLVLFNKFCSVPPGGALSKSLLGELPKSSDSRANKLAWLKKATSLEYKRDIASLSAFGQPAKHDAVVHHIWRAEVEPSSMEWLNTNHVAFVPGADDTFL